MHRMTCSSRFTWHHNITDSDLAEMTKSQKSATSWRLLCMLVLVTTEITKIQGIHPCKTWHGILQNSCRAQVHSMLGSLTKIMATLNLVLTD